MPLAACGTHPHRFGGAEIDLREEASRLASGVTISPGCRELTIGRVVIADPEAPEVAAEDESALPVDAEVVRQALGKVLRDTGAFDAVVVPEDPDAATPRGLVLETRLTRASLGRADDDREIFMPLLSWFFLGFMANWQHDRAYEMKLQPVFALRDPAAKWAPLKFSPPAGEVRERLSTLERRSGAGGFVATVFWWPHFALGTAAEDVARSLAPATLIKAPVRDLLAGMGALRIRYRVRPVVHQRTGIQVDLVAPKPQALVADPVIDLEMRITVRPVAGRPKKVVVGGTQEVPASGVRAIVRLPGVKVEPGKPLKVDLVLERGEPIAVLEIELEKELAPAAGKQDERDRQKTPTLE